MALHYSNKRKLSIKEMRSWCTYWKPLLPFKEKLLILALENNPQAVHDVLYKFGFMVQELAEYPYFKIILKDNR
jgi:hypothetical protein